MTCLEKIQVVSQQESAVSALDGWLFTDFAGRDNLTKDLLHLPLDGMTTRRWIYIVPPTGEPVKILHKIESHVLDSLPGKKEFFYSSQQELKEILSQYKDKTLALLWDQDLPVISTVDGGFISLLQQEGIKITSAARLLQRYKGILSAASIQSQERAAALLYKIIGDTWNFICQHYKSKEPLNERAVQIFILEQFYKYKLTTNHSPVVAFGAHSGDPHYEVPENGGKVAEEGDIIQLDIWAKERLADDGQGSVSAAIPAYADISWVGVFGQTVPEEAEKRFSVLCQARDSVATTVAEAATKGIRLTGAQLDLQVRSIIEKAGYGSYIKHRTGHGIDSEVHGSGVNLDGSEFPDYREILPGSSFSVEPGIYGEDFGMRTEIDIYIDEAGMPIVSGKKFNQGKLGEHSIPQQKILTTKDVL